IPTGVTSWASASSGVPWLRVASASSAGEMASACAVPGGRLSDIDRGLASCRHLVNDRRSVVREGGGQPCGVGDGEAGEGEQRQADEWCRRGAVAPGLLVDNH